MKKTITTVATPKHSNCHGNAKYKVVWIESAKCWIVDSNQFGLWIDPRDVA